MIRDRDAWLDQIKSIEREALIMKLAAARLGHQVRGDSTILANSQLTAKDLRLAIGNVEATYLIRLFAEFESGLRSFWGTIKVTHPRVKDLLDGLASNQGMDERILAATHLVREYRNSLVHERTKEIDPITLATARGTCCKFLSRLPESWN